MNRPVARSASTRVALWIWYRGDPFRGFQAQAEGPTVQQTLAHAFEQAGLPTGMAPAGRTDLGVHARMQVLSVRWPTGRAPGTAVDQLRELLPSGALGIASVKEAKPSFHAQWSATSKEYRYRLSLAPLPPDQRNLCWSLSDQEEQRRVAPDRLRTLLARAVGTRDFSAFHEKSSPIKPRTLASAELVERGDGHLEARLRGSGFGRYQVRYLVGSAVAVASGRLDEAAYDAALSSAAPLRGLKAPAAGLVLWEVCYPNEIDPFSPDERASAGGVPRVPPFL